MRAVVVLLAACSGPAADDTPGEPVDAATTAGTPLRDALLASLIAQMDRGAVMFGQQRFNLTGVNPDGTQWLAGDRVDRSDAKAVTGKHPVVMGFDAWDLAIKPADWTPTPTTTAAAAQYVFDQGGIVTMDFHMRGCTKTDSFNAAGNEGCLCQIANDDAFARAWLIDQNYAKVADALIAHGLDRVPIIVRPLHELDGNWFWWGQPYWACSGPVTGNQAFQRVYKTIHDYLRVERGLANLLFAYSPGHANGYLDGYPGDAYVDVLGLDLYYQGQSSFATQSAGFRAGLATLAQIAADHHKAAALTEVGDTTIATDSTPWFSQYLLPLLAGSRMAYALVWENRRNAAQEFWLPYDGHPLAPDVRAFESDPATLFLGDQPPLY